MASLIFHHFLLFLLPLYAARPFQQCPSFNCGSLGEVGFPFINANGSSGDGCGSFILSCTEDPVPTIQFHRRGKWYPIERLSYSQSYFRGIIVIRDPELQSQLESNQCKPLCNFTDGVVASSSLKSDVTTDVLFPFFRCERLHIYRDDILPSFGKFTDCIDDYNLYFSKEYNSILPTLPRSLSNLCSTVQLPKPLWWDNNNEIVSSHKYPEVAGRWNPGAESIGNLTSLWGANFSLSWEILPPCLQCLNDREGLCLQDQNGTFLCGGLKDYASGKKGKGTKIAIALSISASAIVLIMIISYYCSRKTDVAASSVFFWKRTKNAPLFEDFLQCHALLTPKRYSYSDIKSMTKSFKEKLGEGGFGGVFKGKLPDGRFVAVKVLKESKGSGEDFINEVASISRTSHVNIVRLVGFCSEGSSRALVYEFMPNGSLDKFIYNKSCSILNLEMLYEIALGIARGLEYLHRGCNTRIVHFDIKPHNILLDENFCPKISDFGLAKLCQRKDSIISMLGARGTIGYIAPELVCVNFGGVSHKSDVYSYGMMVLEMVGGRHNTDVGVDRTSEIYFPYWIHQHLVQEEEDLRLHGVESEAEREIAKKMILVGLWCIQTNPCDRPSMSRVLEMLEGSLESLETPPKPFLYSPKRSPVESSAN